MHRLLAICISGVWLAGLPDAAVGQEPLPSDSVIAPRTDVYSVYSDAFFNPESVMQYGAATNQVLDGKWKKKRRINVTLRNDVMFMWRTKSSDATLVRTSENIFDPDPGTIGPDINGSFAGDPLFGNLITPVPPLNGVIVPGAPNDPEFNEVFDQFGNALGDVPEFLIPGEPRMTAGQFDFSSKLGFRPTIALEFQSGDSLEFSYFYIKDYTAGTLVDDVSGSAFLTTVISTTNLNPSLAAFQRFGYLSADFAPTQPEFAGERRRQIGMDPSAAPHFTPVEIPPVPFAIINMVFPTSRDVPREPTVNDPDRLGVLNGPEDTASPSLLWQDGELAFADYAFDIQGGELLYTRPIRKWQQNNFQLKLLTGVRHIALDEGFSFFFADVAGFDTPIPAQNPFDRFLANNPDPTFLLSPRAQPSNETYATLLNTIDNDMVGPEIGLDAKLPMLGILELDMMGKAGFMFNFLSKTQQVIRGDGLSLYDPSIITKDAQSTSGLIEGRFGLNLYLLPNLKLRGGVEFLWLINVGMIFDNLDSDLTNVNRPSNNSSTLFGGYFVGAEATF